MIVNVLPKGSSVTIDCHVIGQTVNGTAIWNHLLTGGFVSDSLILTGSNNPVVPKCGAYQRDAAAKWALAHVYDKERYPNNDCTWFVSQALWQGGLKKTSAWSPTANFGRPTLDAVNADHLKNYLVNETKQATITELSWRQNNVPAAQLGDVIAYDFRKKDGSKGADGVIDHLMIVTGFSGQYPLVSGHTAPASNQGWTWSKASNNWYEKVFPGSRVYLIHIKN